MLTSRYYRPIVVVCALSWFLLGLHVPAIHAMTHHGRPPQWGVLAILCLLAAAGIAGLWVLLRAPSASEKGARPAGR